MSTEEDEKPGSEKQAASIRKIEANRQNSLKSTGPNTPRGKTYSRRNAIKHGLFTRHWADFFMVGEDSQEYDELLGDLFDEHRPAGREEELEVERITVCWWKLKRVSRYDNSVNRVAARDLGTKELARQREYCETRDKQDEATILELKNIENEIEATDVVPPGLKERIFAMSPGLAALWSTLERTAENSMKKLDLPEPSEELSLEERTPILAVCTIGHAIRLLEELQKARNIGVMEVATAQHLIPDREVLDRILRYETAIERNLGRALDRLERLQRRRKGEPVLPPVNVRLTR